MKKVWILVLILAVVTCLAFAGSQATRAGYESAPYQVLQSEGKFQVRDYPALIVAETPMSANARGGDDGSFMRLFGFINGGNEAKQKIAMTTPVLMSGRGTNASMAFVMPVKLKPAGVSRPSDGSVTVRELEAGRFAVLRYSGSRSPTREAESLERLRAWMKAQGLMELSAPVYGYFDPPWTPAFLRRNEVMLRIGPASPHEDPSCPCTSVCGGCERGVPQTQGLPTAGRPSSLALDAKEVLVVGQDTQGLEPARAKRLDDGGHNVGDRLCGQVRRADEAQHGRRIGHNRCKINDHNTRRSPDVLNHGLEIKAEDHAIANTAALLGCPEDHPVR